MIGVFVNSKHVPYARMICDARKPIETRSKNTLKKLVGQEVCIVETGSGEPFVVGEVTITDSFFVTKRMWDAFYRALACVPYGSEYDSNNNGKWCYTLWHPLLYDKPFALPKNAIRHGRAWCEFEI